MRCMDLLVRHPRVAVVRANIRRRALGTSHPDTLRTPSKLASLFHHTGRNAEAEAMHREVLEAQRKVLGASHPDTLRTMKQLGLHG